MKLEEFLKFIECNPYTGSSQEIVDLSLGIFDASMSLDDSIFYKYKKRSGVNEKVFSKLKVIGKSLRSLTDKQLALVIPALPSSYTTIHSLCSGLTAEELVTSVKRKEISKNLSTRSALKLVKQMRFPKFAASTGTKQLWGQHQSHLFSIYKPEGLKVDDASLNSFQDELKDLCESYGLILRNTQPSDTTTLLKQERSEQEVFWRAVLDNELPQSWFDTTSDELRKQFNIRSLEELVNTPIRSFTGFLVNAEGSRKQFWLNHGKAYIAKLQLEQQKTDNKSQRFNLRTRIEKVMGERTELAIWNNQVLMNSGFI